MSKRNDFKLHLHDWGDSSTCCTYYIMLHHFTCSRAQVMPPVNRNMSWSSCWWWRQWPGVGKTHRCTWQSFWLPDSTSYLLASIILTDHCSLLGGKPWCLAVDRGAEPGAPLTAPVLRPENALWRCQLLFESPKIPPALKNCQSSKVVRGCQALRRTRSFPNIEPEVDWRISVPLSPFNNSVKCPDFFCKFHQKKALQEVPDKPKHDLDGCSILRCMGNTHDLVDGFPLMIITLQTENVIH